MIALVFTACKKDQYTTAPQIKFKSISPQYVDGSVGSATPILTLSVTDAEGDIGPAAFVYMKNLLTATFDSVPFPDLQTAAKSHFKADVDIDIAKVLKCKSLPGSPPPLHTDTLYFEIYMKDIAKNKSNIIQTDKPVYFYCR
jgi:hypothetical protein